MVSLNRIVTNILRTLSTILAALELFKPDLLPWIGWHTDNPTYETKAADISTTLPEQSVV